MKKALALLLVLLLISGIVPVYARETWQDYYTRVLTDELPEHAQAYFLADVMACGTPLLYIRCGTEEQSMTLCTYFSLGGISNPVCETKFSNCTAFHVGDGAGFLGIHQMENGTESVSLLSARGELYELGSRTPDGAPFAFRAVEEYPVEDLSALDKWTADYRDDNFQALDAFSRQIARYKVGSTLEDLTFTDCEGNTFSLYGLLDGKEYMLLNFFFIDCRFCNLEFPFLEQAYQKYGDRMAFLCVSSGDTAEALREYRAQLGLTLPMTDFSCPLTKDFFVNYFPASYILDASGTVLAEIGTLTSMEETEAIFDSILAGSLTQQEDSDTEAVYSFSFVDQNNLPVQGVMMNLCDENTCTVLVSDEAGMASITRSPYPCEVHILSVPDGYVIDPSFSFTTGTESSAYIFPITKQ